MSLSLPPLRYAPLPGRALLRLRGEEAGAFLQGLVTNDMRKVAPNTPVYTLFLTPQGKFLHDFFAYGEEGGLLLETGAARAGELAARLKRFRLKRAVEIAPLPEEGWGAYALSAVPGALPAFMRGGADPRHPGLGARLVGERAAVEAWLAGLGAQAVASDTFEEARLALGVPEGEKDMEPEQAFPMQYGMDRLHAIDFEKGCYVGQEVTARMRYRGNIKKGIYLVRAERGAAPPPGTPVSAGGKPVGEMRSGHGDAGIALLSHEELQRAQEAGLALESAGIILAATIPSWAADGAFPMGN